MFAQLLALLALVPPLAIVSIAIMIPTAVAVILVAWFGKETRGRDLPTMRGLELGLDRFKFFPAEPAGGIPALKALSGPFANVRLPDRRHSS